MNTALRAVLLASTMALASAAHAQVSVNVGVPGLYGRVDIGGYPPPPVLYAQPVYGVRGPPGPPGEPLYLHVPPGYEKHWRQRCGEYDACGRPVYFVRHDWYRDVYAHRGERGRPDERHEERRDERGPRDGGDRRDDRDRR